MPTRDILDLAELFDRANQSADLVPEVLADFVVGVPQPVRSPRDCFDDLRVALHGPSPDPLKLRSNSCGRPSSALSM